MSLTKIPKINKYIKYAGLIISLVVIYFLTSWARAYINEPKTPKLPEPPLKTLAKDQGIALGNFAIASRIKEKPYNGILTSQFDFVTIDNTPNWHFTDYDLRPGPDKYDFSHIDRLMTYAESKKMPVQMHHYVWGDDKWLPDWLKNGKYSPEQLSQILHDHIQTVGSRYSGRVAEWTVVNEAFSRQQHLFDLHDWWADHTGSQQYIDDSFRWAREADPKSKLILNDFNNEVQNNTSNNMYDYLKDALARGVPIDGIGMQMHIDGTHPPKKDEVKENMLRFAELGLKVYVTEFDINMNDVKADAVTKNNIEGDIYYEMLRACIESKVCPSFAYLGITDKETWYNYIGLPDPRPLMFDWDYKPKPAFYSTREALLQK